METAFGVLLVFKKIERDDLSGKSEGPGHEALKDKFRFIRVLIPPVLFPLLVSSIQPVT